MAYDYKAHWRDFGDVSMQVDFAPGELKAELERSLGFAIRSFRRLKCVNSMNFKAVRDSDGFAVTVKCMPEWRKLGYDQTVLHLRELRGSKSVQRVFEQECPERFRGHYLLCLAWCEGAGVSPDRITADQLRAFLEDYLGFSAALQNTTGSLPAYPTVRWRREALAKCRGFWGGLLKKAIEAIPEEESGFREDRLRVTHGDLHPGNFAFANGRVTGFLDVEGLTLGYPAWDLVRYFYFCASHLGFWQIRRRRLLLERFAETVRYLPYECDEWKASINAIWFEQVWKKTDGRRLSPAAVAQLLAVNRIFRRFEKAVEETL